MQNVDNMEIWNSMYNVPSEFIKPAKLSGGFKIKSIDAMYQIRTVTEKWGAFGTLWGVKEEDIHFIKDIPGSRKDRATGNWVPCLKTMAVYKAMFFYPGGSFPILSDIEFDDSGDSLKKVKTDALTKGFSMLGISGSVFMGEHDHLGGKYPTTASPQARQEPRTPQAVIDKGVEFKPVTGQGDQHPAQSQYETQDQGYYQQEQQYSQQPPRQQAPQGDLGVCDVCGAPNKLSQKGKTYCGALCWKGGDDGR